MAYNYKLLYKLSDLSDCVNVVKFSKSGEYLAFCCDDGGLKIVETTSSKTVCMLHGASTISALLWHPCDERKIFIGYADGTIRIHSVGDESVVRQSHLHLRVLWSHTQQARPIKLAVPGGVDCMSCDNDAFLAVGCGDNVLIYDMPTDDGE